MKTNIESPRPGHRGWHVRAIGRLVRLGAAMALALTGGAVLAAGAAYYYDGAQKLPIQLRTDLAADFSRPSAQATSANAQAVAATSTVAGDSLVRIYRVPSVVVRSADAAGATTGASPVYAQGDSGRGRLMALPGGVMVKFKPDWTRARIDAWLAERGAKVGRALGMQGNWFLVDTAPGSASLELANSMFESGEVLSASPNWWMQTSTR
jgi:hypothetical protein